MLNLLTRLSIPFFAFFHISGISFTPFFIPFPISLNGTFFTPFIKSPTPGINPITSNTKFFAFFHISGISFTPFFIPFPISLNGTFFTPFIKSPTPGINPITSNTKSPAILYFHSQFCISYTTSITSAICPNTVIHPTAISPIVPSKFVLSPA